MRNTIIFIVFAVLVLAGAYVIYNKRNAQGEPAAAPAAATEAAGKEAPAAAAPAVAAPATETASGEPAATVVYERPALLDDPYHAELWELRKPREKFLAEVNALDAKIRERKAVIAENNPEVAALAAEIKVLEEKYAATATALEMKFSEDAELKDLKTRAEAARSAFTATFNAAYKKPGETATGEPTNE